MIAVNWWRAGGKGWGGRGKGMGMSVQSMGEMRKDLWQTFIKGFKYLLQLATKSMHGEIDEAQRSN